MSQRTLKVELNLRTMLLAIGAVAGVWLLLQLWPVLLTIVCALMLVGALNPFVNRLERHMKRRWAVGIVFLVLLLALGGFVALTAPAFGAQVSDLVEHFPEKQQQLLARIEHMRLGAPLARSVREANLGDLAKKGLSAGMAYAGAATELLAYAASAVFLALYVMLDRDRMRGALFAVVPRTCHVRLSRVLLNLETIVGGYVRGQVITSAMMAIFTFIVLTIARVPNALALAVFAGVVDVLPYVGALLACGPAALVVLSTRGPTAALVVLVVLAAYQELESRLIIPRVYGRVLRLPAAVVLVALLVGAKLLGIVGAVLSLPIAAGLRMLVQELRVALPGERGVDVEALARDDRAELEYDRRAADAPAAVAAAIAVDIASSRQKEEAKHEKDPREAATAPISVRPLTPRNT